MLPRCHQRVVRVDAWVALGQRRGRREHRPVQVPVVAPLEAFPTPHVVGNAVEVTHGVQLPHEAAVQHGAEEVPPLEVLPDHLVDRNRLPLVVRTATIRRVVQDPEPVALPMRPNHQPSVTLFVVLRHELLHRHGIPRSDAADLHEVTPASRGVVLALIGAVVRVALLVSPGEPDAVHVRLRSGGIRLLQVIPLPRAEGVPVEGRKARDDVQNLDWLPRRFRLLRRGGHVTVPRKLTDSGPELGLCIRPSRMRLG